MAQYLVKLNSITSNSTALRETAWHTFRRCSLKARLHRRFLSRQLDAIFVALKLQLQNRTCKPGAIFSAICRRDIAGVSNMFETCCNFSATKIASSCRDKNRLCKRALRSRTQLGVKWYSVTSNGTALREMVQHTSRLIREPISERNIFRTSSAMQCMEHSI